jgi:hypothetical protein
MNEPEPCRLQAAVRKLTVLRSIEILEGLLGENLPAGDAEWTSVASMLTGAGVNGLVHGGSTAWLKRLSGLVKLRGIGDFDLLMTDREGYDFNAAQEAMSALMVLLARRLGGSVSEDNLLAPATPATLEGRKSDLARRLGLRNYHLDVEYDHASIEGYFSNRLRSSLSHTEQVALENCLRQRRVVKATVKLSMKVGNSSGNLRPMLGYQDADGSPVKPSGRRMYPRLMSLDPACRTAIKIHYALNKAAPSPGKSHLDIALMTGVLHSLIEGEQAQVLSELPTLVAPYAPMLRFAFVAVTPILHRQPNFGSLAFEHVDPQLPAAVQKVLSDLERMAVADTTLPVAQKKVAHKLMQSTFDLLHHVIGLRRLSKGGYGISMTDSEVKYVSACALLSASSDTSYGAEIRPFVRALVQELPDASRAQYSDLEDDIVYTITRFSISRHAVLKALSYSGDATGGG